MHPTRAIRALCCPLVALCCLVPPWAGVPTQAAMTAHALSPGQVCRQVALRLSDLPVGQYQQKASLLTGSDIAWVFNVQFQQIGRNYNAPGGEYSTVVIYAFSRLADAKSQMFIEATAGDRPWNPAGVGDQEYGFKGAPWIGQIVPGLELFFRRGRVVVDLAVVGNDGWLQPAIVAHYARLMDARIKHLPHGDA